jgi:hypothetical protein
MSDIDVLTTIRKADYEAEVVAVTDAIRALKQQAPVACEMYGEEINSLERRMQDYLDRVYERTQRRLPQHCRDSA